MPKIASKVKKETCKTCSGDITQDMFKKKIKIPLNNESFLFASLFPIVRVKSSGIK